MRFFASGPRVLGIRPGVIVSRRDISMLFPLTLWRPLIYVALGLATFGAVMFVADFVHYLP